MQINPQIKSLSKKIKELKNLNKIIGIVVGSLLILWAISVLWLRETDIKTAENAQELKQLAQNIRKHYQNRPDYWGLNTKTVIEKKIAPQNMVINGELKSLWGTPILAGNGIDGAMLMPGSRNFDIIIKNLNTQQCVELASFKFDEKFWLGVISVTINNSSKFVAFDWSNPSNKLPISTEAAKALCSDHNAIIWHYE